jgi:hypothetical protein
MEPEEQYGDAKTEIAYDSATRFPRDWDTLHATHQDEQLMDSKFKAYIHDHTGKDKLDYWDADEPSIERDDPVENLEDEEDEGYNVAEHPDSIEDEFDDQDRS